MLLGKDISLMKDADISSLRRKEVAFISQFYNLIPNLNVEENILLPIILDNKRIKDYKDKLEEILEIVGLSDRKKHRPSQLSGGQQQRVAIARALIGDPDIIMADEPTGNLDSKTGIEVLELLHKIHEEKGKTIIMVTHSYEAAAYGNRHIYLKDGQIIQDEINLPKTSLHIAFEEGIIN